MLHTTFHLPLQFYALETALPLLQTSLNHVRYTLSSILGLFEQEDLLEYLVYLPHS